MKTEKQRSLSRFRQRVFRMVSVGVVDEPINTAYDVISTLALIVNLIAAVLTTFDNLDASYGALFDGVEAVTVFFFAVDYALRLFTANNLYPDLPEGKSLLRYVTSFAGIVDLLSFLPYYLPFFFPAGAVVFRLFRIVRIFRLFRINAYYDSLNVITEVIAGKKQQLLSSMFILAVLMLASSLCMYSLEHEAQPEVFSNAFSGLWWSVSTLLTIGYGDIYPITPLGKAVSIFITFLGVLMVAIPTGIISAGFVEQYSRLKRFGDYAREEALNFVAVELSSRDAWCGKAIKDLQLPRGALIAAVKRDGEVVVPRGDVVLKPKDRLVLCAEAIKGEQPINLRELILGPNHEWNGCLIRDLDLSRQSYIVLVRRRGTMLVPRGSTKLLEGDTVILYSKEKPREPIL
ncbi:MAG: ion transporter [Oscillospiraceae bacterium]|nr:ion transporter [Oscillospiraceae bacterium]